MILYLHGFRSSPQSFKARALAARLDELGRADEWRCPVLSVAPLAAIAAAEAEVAGVPAQRVTVIGSSLGGYYATWLAEKHGWRAVLLNPRRSRSGICAVISASSRCGTAAARSSSSRIIWTN